MHQYLRRLTPLRFVAAIFVVLFHYGRGTPPFDGSWPLALISAGNMAVSFFFCLSGFIMATVYAGSTTPARAYWFARIARIYPVYLLTLLMMWWLIGATPLQLILQVLLLQSWVPGFALSVNGPAWSLSVEAFFYLIFPLLTSQLSQRNLTRLAKLTILMWLVTQFVTFYARQHFYHGYPSKSHDLIFYFPLLHLNEFLIGVVAGAAFPILNKEKTELSTFYTGFIVLLSTIGLSNLLAGPSSFFGLLVLHDNGLNAPVFTGIVWFVASLPSSWAKPLEPRLFVALGESSYAMYLLQDPLRILFDRRVAPLIIHAPQSASLGLYLVVLIVLSLLVYTCFERPMRSLLKNLSRFTPRLTAAR